MTFWSNPQQFAEPLKQNRWLLRITTLEGAEIISLESVKECSKPSFKIGVSEHKLLNNTYKYPTVVTWNPVTIKFLNIKNGFVWTSESIKTRTNYIDNSKFNAISNISKSEIKFNLDIQQIDENGRVVEVWSLYNAFFSSIENGNLSYANDDFVEMTAEIQYDWAELQNNEPLNGLDVDLAISSDNEASAGSKGIKALEIQFPGSYSPKTEAQFNAEEAKLQNKVEKTIPSINTSKTATTTYADLSTDEFKKLTANTKPVAYGVIGSNLQNRINDEKTGKEVSTSKDVEKKSISNREAAAQEQAKIKAAGGGLEIPKQVSSQELEAKTAEQQGADLRQRRAIGTEQNAESTCCAQDTRSNFKPVFKRSKWRYK